MLFQFSELRRLILDLFLAQLLGIKIIFPSPKLQNKTLKNLFFILSILLNPLYQFYYVLKWWWFIFILTQANVSVSLKHLIVLMNYQKNSSNAKKNKKTKSNLEEENDVKHKKES